MICSPETSLILKQPTDPRRVPETEEKNELELVPYKLFRSAIMLIVAERR